MEVSTAMIPTGNGHGNNSNNSSGGDGGGGNNVVSTDLLVHGSDIFHTGQLSPYQDEHERDEHAIYATYTPDSTYASISPPRRARSSSPASPLPHHAYSILPNADKEAAQLFEPINACLFRGGAKGRAEGMLGSESFPCQCQYEPDVDDREVACGEDSNCVNRHLYIECNPEDCPCGNYCLNRRFQLKEYASVQVIKTDKKGYGIQAIEGIESNAFVMEYVGEVLPQSWFVKRARQYAQEGIAHHYFMTLNSEEYIDATKKGSYARFINHSCNPNCVLQKWTVGARTRMGIFTLRRVLQGEELTFDYKFQRYGAEAQPCYCGESNCKGFIGGEAKSSQKTLELDFAFLSTDASLSADGEMDMEAAVPIRRRRGRLSKGRRGRGRRLMDDESDEDEDNENYEEDEYEDELEEDEDDIRTSTKHRPRGLQTIEQVEKFVPLMMKYANQLDYAQKLLMFLNMTESPALLRKFMNTHGLQVLKLYLVEYHHKNDELCQLVLGLMGRLPITIRNTINACGADHVVDTFTSHEDATISEMATKLIDDWKELKVVYKIPKRSKLSSKSNGVHSTNELAQQQQQQQQQLPSSPSIHSSPTQQHQSYSDRHSLDDVDDDDYSNHYQYNSNNNSQYGSPRPWTHRSHNQHHYYSRHYDSTSTYHRPTSPFSHSHSQHSHHNHHHGHNHHHNHHHSSYSRSNYNSSYYRRGGGGPPPPPPLPPTSSSSSNTAHSASYHRTYPSPHYSYSTRYNQKSSSTTHHNGPPISYAATEFDEANLPREPLAMRQLSQNHTIQSSSSPTLNRSAPPSPSRPPPLNSHRHYASTNGSTNATSSSSRMMTMMMVKDSPDAHKHYGSSSNNNNNNNNNNNGYRESSHSNGGYRESTTSYHPPHPLSSSPASPRHYNAQSLTSSVASPPINDEMIGYSSGASVVYTPNTPSASADSIAYNNNHNSISNNNDSRSQKSDTTTTTHTNGNANGSTNGTTRSSELLPPNWKSATSPDGVYYYNTVTGKTQWSRPEWDTANKEEERREEMNEEAKKRTEIEERNSAFNATYTLSKDETTNNMNGKESTTNTILHTKRKQSSLSTEDHSSDKTNTFTSQGRSQSGGIGRDRKRRPTASNGSALNHASTSSSPLPTQQDERLIRELRVKVSEIVVKCLSKYKVEFGDTERFKKEAKKMAEVMVEKERRGEPIRAGKLPDFDEAYRNRVKKFVKDCMTRFRAKAVIGRS